MRLAILGIVPFVSIGLAAGVAAAEGATRASAATESYDAGTTVTGDEMSARQARGYDAGRALSYDAGAALNYDGGGVLGYDAGTSLSYDAGSKGAELKASSLAWDAAAK